MVPDLSARTGSPEVVEEPLRLPAPDGYELGGVFYAPPGIRESSLRRVAVVHGGAGIPAARYGRFARFLAASRIGVLTYDYRGIGLSRPSTLRGFAAAVEDWAEYDCAAAIAWLRKRSPQAELIGIAHSVGALLVGGAHNSAEQNRLVLVGAHTGYYGDYRPLYRLPMAVLWHGLMPVVTRALGYFPARRLGLGEDIPAGIALQWAMRRSAGVERAAARAGAPQERTRRLLARCAALERPALLIGFTDDAFATAAGARRLLAYYPRLKAKRLEYSPTDAGVRRIGHFGFFGRLAGPALWPRLLAELDTAQD